MLDSGMACMKEKVSHMSMTCTKSPSALTPGQCDMQGSIAKIWQKITGPETSQRRHGTHTFGWLLIRARGNDPQHVPPRRLTRAPEDKPTLSKVVLAPKHTAAVLIFAMAVHLDSTSPADERCSRPRPRWEPCEHPSPSGLSKPF